MEGREREGGSRANCRGSAWFCVSWNALDVEGSSHFKAVNSCFPIKATFSFLDRVDFLDCVFDLVSSFASYLLRFGPPLVRFGTSLKSQNERFLRKFLKYSSEQSIPQLCRAVAVDSKCYHWFRLIFKLDHLLNVFGWWILLRGPLRWWFSTLVCVQLRLSDEIWPQHIIIAWHLDTKPCFERWQSKVYTVKLD